MRKILKSDLEEGLLVRANANWTTGGVKAGDLLTISEVERLDGSEELWHARVRFEDRESTFDVDFSDLLHPTIFEAADHFKRVLV